MNRDQLNDLLSLVRGGFIERATTMIEQELAKPKQEPVAWMYKGNFHDFDPSEWASPEFVVTPLYTAPPKREWVGLTELEVKHYNNRLSGSNVAQEIESKLRERNT